MPMKFHRAAYHSVTQAERNGYTDADASEMSLSLKPKSSRFNSFLKAALLVALCVASFITGMCAEAKRREYQERYNTFMPRIPLVGEPTYFLENKTWSTPGPVSDALWNEERETMANDRFIKIEDPKKYGIPEGTRDKKGGLFYSVSVYHQLHCLAMFRAIVYNTTTSKGTETGDAEGWSHLGHCFNYVRTAIRCHADSALEWPEYAKQPDGSMRQQPDTALLGCRRLDVLDKFVAENKWVNP